jgi:hypothetical protein
MANPLKILTVLTASEAAQFKKAVQVETGGLTVSAGDTNVQKLVSVGELTASAAAKFNDKVTVGSDLRQTVILGALNPNAEAAISGTVLATSLISLSSNAAFGSFSSLFRAYDTFNQTQFYISGTTGAVSGSGAAQFGGALTVGGAATLRGGADVNSQKITNLADATASTDAVAYGQVTGLSSSFSSSLAAEIAARIADVDAEETRALAAETALSGAVSSSLVAEAAARAAEDLTFLKLDGSRAMTGALDMGNQNITNAKSGSFAGDVTVAGNLQVNGQLTYVNSVNLEVTDKLVTIAKGAANGAAADGAGIEVDGAGVSFVYDNTAGKWVSDIGLSVANEASFDGAMKLSGSTFAYIATPISSGKYDVNDAIRALDVAVSGAVSAGGQDLANVKASYDALRQVVTGTLSSGTALLTLAGDQFAAGQIDNLALDVMIDADNTGYTNDLVAIKMYVDGAAVKVQIDAPAAASAKYRLIVVNEKDGGLDVI